MPSFTSIVQNNRIENEAYRIFSLLKTTRNSAITSNRRHFLCRSDNALSNEDGTGAACASAGLTNFDWNNDLLVYGLLAGDPDTVPNANFNNQRLQEVGSADTDLIKQQMVVNVSAAGNDGVDIIASSGDNVFVFTPEGALLNDAPIHIAVCDERDDPEEYGQLITINTAGLIRLSNTDATDSDLDCTPNA
ncbi:GspH/FimT family pseudopilin [Arenicella sp.]|nr:GspH/FimT family pseudopilin [Arenicella sp.]